MRKGKQKKGKKANIQFSVFTHASYCGSETTTMTASYCGSETTTMTAECNGSGEFGDDVDVVQTSDTG